MTQQIQKGLLFLTIISCCTKLFGQQIPDNPTSIQIFSPHVYNPAITGSKDFLNINFTARIEGRPKAQIISGHARLLRPETDHLFSESGVTYSNFGVGGYIFNDQTGSFNNIGFSASGAYHLPLSRKAITFLSLGAAFNGTLSMPDNDAADPGDENPGNTFYPNADLGVFFYNPRISAGFSITNILGNLMQVDSLKASSGLSTAGFHFQVGYKIVLSRSQSIILEPSVYINSIDSTSGQFYNDVNPTLKLYFKNFYIGTYYSSRDLLSYFMQYQFNRLYTGFFIEFPIEKLVNQSNIKIELAIGMNLQNRKIQIRKNRFW